MVRAGVSSGLQAAGNSGGKEEGWRLVGARPHLDSGVFCVGTLDAAVKELGQLINTALHPLRPILRTAG